MIIQRLTQITHFELDELQSLICQLDPDPRTISLADISSMLKQGELFLFVIRDDRKFNMPIIGMASIIIYQIPTCKKGYIEDVVVDQNYRGLGLGRQLTQKCIDTARENNAKYIDLTSNPSRVAANELYKKMGFERRETNVYRMKL